MSRSASAPAEPWTWAGAIALNGSDAPVIAEANARRVHLATGAEMPFPGTAAAKLSPESILPFDFNYDFKTDLLLAGDKGLRLFRQDNPNHFTDVTAGMKLPTAVTNAAYTGAWAIDLEADGDLDVVLGTKGRASVRVAEQWRWNLRCGASFRRRLRHSSVRLGRSQRRRQSRCIADRRFRKAAHLSQ